MTLTPRRRRATTRSPAGLYDTSKTTRLLATAPSSSNSSSTTHNPTTAASTRSRLPAAGQRSHSGSSSPSASLSVACWAPKRRPDGRQRVWSARSSGSRPDAVAAKATARANVLRDTPGDRFLRGQDIRNTEQHIAREEGFRKAEDFIATGTATGRWGQETLHEQREAHEIEHEKDKLKALTDPVELRPARVRPGAP